MKPDKSLGVIIAVGYCLIIMGIIGLIMYFSLLDNELYTTGFRIFVLSFTFINLFTGMGVVLRKMFGYYMLKAYLYFLILGFPVGTLISIKALKQIKASNINSYFK